MRLPQLVTQLLLDVEHPVLEAVRQVHVLRGVQVDGHAGVLVGPFGELLVLEDDLATELLCAGQLLQKKSSRTCPPRPLVGCGGSSRTR